VRPRFVVTELAASAVKGSVAETLVLDRAWCWRVVASHTKRSEAAATCAELNAKHPEGWPV
jgi:hypothetical protein